MIAPNRSGLVAFGLAAALGAAVSSRAEDRLPPIQQVAVTPQRCLEVNGQPFFPLMAWLQDASNFPAVKECGMNTVAGYWPGSSGTKDVAEYLALVESAGLYGVMAFDARLAGRGCLLGYIHEDEPDLPHQVSDAQVIPGANLRLNRQTPLWKLLDGVTHTWSVLDPLEGATVTIRLPEPVVAESLAVWQTISPGLAVAKEVVFSADGQEILTAVLKAERGQQRFALSKPVRFKELMLCVRSTYPGREVWGSLGEVEAWDASGRNVLLAPPRQEPRSTPEDVLRKYQAMKAADPSRPVFMTLTGYFHPHFSKWTETQRQSLYPAYIAGADVVGYDIYPIYGWNKPEWIHLVHDATVHLAGLAGQRPIYAWIETSKGGQWTGPLDRQQDVTPTHIRAEVWMAICGGARIIGYFTHVWKPTYQQFGVPEENRRALRSINEQITRLAPVILGPSAALPVTVSAGEVKIAALAKPHDGCWYVFAVNYDERSRRAQATIRLEGLPAGAEVVVVDESRTLRTDPGCFHDEFQPLAVHIYCIQRAGGKSGSN